MSFKTYLKSMKRSHLSILLAGLLISGCGRSVFSPKEPPGTPVALSAEDTQSANLVFASSRDWYIWHNKGVKLSLAGQYSGALYCFNEAMKAWPKTISEEERKRSILKRHSAEPTDTILQKAALYMKMNEPKLALYYYKKFNDYIPNQSFCLKGMEDAKKMMEKK